MEENYYNSESDAEEAVDKNTADAVALARRQLINRGRLQGFIVTFIAMIFMILVVLGIIVVISIKNERFSPSLVYGTASDSVIDGATKKKLDVLQSIIERYYLYEYTEDDLKNGLYQGLFAGLGDPYSCYYTVEQYDEMTEDAEGVFEGIGAYLTQDAETRVVTVVRPIKDSPAEKAGILADDILVEVDGENIEGDDLNVTVAKIRGKAGTSVKIGVMRPGKSEMLTFDIVRASVESQSVDSKMLQDSIGYIQISQFDDVTGGQFERALKELRREEMTGLIIDLRDNPGGNVSTCVDIADQLLKEGIVVYTEDKNGKREEYKSDAENYYDGPLVVLVNGNSASSSEILTGAIKDYGAGTILGTTTYGKGIVQQVLPLGDGSGIKVTIANYFTPNGINIHGVGIEPDEVLELDVEAYLKDKTDNQLDRAIELIEEEIKK